jgi:hypothetical protein
MAATVFQTSGARFFDGAGGYPPQGSLIVATNGLQIFHFASHPQGFLKVTGFNLLETGAE